MGMLREYEDEGESEQVDTCELCGKDYGGSLSNKRAHESSAKHIARLAAGGMITEAANEEEYDEDNTEVEDEGGDEAKEKEERKNGARLCKLGDIFEGKPPQAVAFDTSFCLCLWDLRKRERPLRKKCRKFEQAFRKKKTIEGYVSPWVLNETLHLYRKVSTQVRLHDLEKILKTLQQLSNFSHSEKEEATADAFAIMTEALRMHGEYGFSITDACIIADACAQNITDFITNDKTWRKVPGITLWWF